MPSRGITFLASAIVIAGTLVCLFTQNLKWLLPFYTGLGNLFMGLLVYFNNRNSKTNISFALISFLVVLWTIAIFLYTESAGPAGALFWSRAAALTSAYIPVFILYFANVFPKEEESVSGFRIFSGLFSATLFAVLSATGLIVNKVAATSAGYRFVPGTAFPFFALYVVLCMSFAFYKLIRKYRTYTGVGRLQIGYVFLGFFLGSFFPVITNLILPFWGHAELAGIGPFFTIITIALVSYAVVKHRLMSIEIVIQRSTVYAVATILIMALYALAVAVSEVYLRKIIGYSSLIVTGLAALLIAVMYQPLVRGFQNFTDRIFFRGRYD